jgi:arylsulfatase A-like enzyme
MLINLEPGWHADDVLFKTGGAAHGSPYSYDTHVPLLWYGARIPRGTTHAPVSITDIAPTVAALLRIMEPNGCTGTVIEALFKP